MEADQVISFLDIDRVVTGSHVSPDDWLGKRGLTAETMGEMNENYFAIILERTLAGEPIEQALHDCLCNAFRAGWECALEFGKGRP